MGAVEASGAWWLAVTAASLSNVHSACTGEAKSAVFCPGSARLVTPDLAR
jgi:hypothetical protein